MSALSIDKELKEFWPKLSPGQKKAVLHVVKSYMVKDIDEKIIPELGVTISEYNIELEEAEAEIERGEFFTHEQMKKQIGQWKKKHAK
jgi:hypothetical protein